MSRVSVGNLLNHTTQSSGGPVGVQPAQAPAQARSAQASQPSQPRLNVYRYVENGREYYAVNNAIAYPFPCDEEEDERLDFLHTQIHDYAFQGRLHHVELQQRGHRAQILDVGHGTGIWIYEMATKTPWADVIGIDLHSRVPAREHGDIPNASFLAPVDFMRPDWPFTPDSFDLIRMSQLCGSVSDWWTLYRNVYRYLQPGIGQVEHMELDWTPRSMAGSSFPQAADELLQWWRDLQRASRQFGKPIDYPSNTEEIMDSLGLTDVTHRIVRWPLLPRPHDHRDDQLRWGFKMMMSEPFASGRIPRGFESLTMSLFTRELRIAPQRVADLCARLRRIVGIMDLPIYFNLHVWTARRPQN